MELGTRNRHRIIHLVIIPHLWEKAVNPVRLPKAELANRSIVNNPHFLLKLCVCVHIEARGWHWMYTLNLVVRIGWTGCLASSAYLHPTLCWGCRYIGSYLVFLEGTGDPNLGVAFKTDTLPAPQPPPQLLPTLAWPINILSKSLRPHSLLFSE